MRVVRKAVLAASTRTGSRHQKPIRAHEVAPMISQLMSRTGSVTAVTVTSMLAAKSSISPKNRARASLAPNSVALKARTARVIDVTVTAISPDSPSTPSWTGN
ncbi:hypothetical protein SMICM17S_03266 [Streptomyces microflavus]